MEDGEIIDKRREHNH